MIREFRMSIDEVCEYFGTLSAACYALGIKRQNITKWKRKGYIPYLQQHRISVLTDGKLLPDEHDPRFGKLKTNDSEKK